MTITFLDMEDAANELNGTVFQDTAALIQSLDNSRSRPPFLCKLTSDKGYYLDVGIGKVGCAQHTCASGVPPYLMAVAPGKEHVKQEAGDYTEFLCGGTPTPVSDRFCMPFELVGEIAVHFLETGRTIRLSRGKRFELVARVITEELGVYVIELSLRRGVLFKSHHI
jgi:hypothetical protein